MFKTTVVSCKKTSFKSNKTGEDVTYYTIYVMCTDGSIGHVNSRQAYKAGDPITFDLTTSNDGLLVVKVAV